MSVFVLNQALTGSIAVLLGYHVCEWDGETDLKAVYRHLVLTAT